MNIRTVLAVALCGIALGIIGLAVAQSDAPPIPMVDRSKYSPYPTKTFPNRVYFGDTHLHTALLDRRRHVRQQARAPTRRIASRAARR